MPVRALIFVSALWAPSLFAVRMGYFAHAGAKAAREGLRQRLGGAGKWIEMQAALLCAARAGCAALLFRLRIPRAVTVQTL